MKLKVPKANSKGDLNWNLCVPQVSFLLLGLCDLSDKLAKPLLANIHARCLNLTAHSSLYEHGSAKDGSNLAFTLKINIQKTCPFLVTLLNLSKSVHDLYTLTSE